MWHNYVCCRDGSKKSIHHVNKTEQFRKSARTRKLGNFCISRMMATESLETKAVKVVYISSHSNHKPGIDECKHLPLPQSVNSNNNL